MAMLLTLQFLLNVVEIILRSKLKNIPRNPLMTSMETFKDTGIKKVSKRKLDKNINPTKCIKINTFKRMALNLWFEVAQIFPSILDIMNNIEPYCADSRQAKQNHKQSSLNNIYFFLNITDFILYWPLVLDNLGIVSSINNHTIHLFSIL